MPTICSLIVFVLGLLGLVVAVSTPPVEGSLVGPWLGFVSLFGVFGGVVFFVTFLLERCLWPRKGDSEDRYSLDDGIRPDS